MSIEIPQALIDMLDSIDRNARAYGWETAKQDEYPPDGTELSPENPFIHANWRDRIVMQTAIDTLIETAPDNRYVEVKEDTVNESDFEEETLRLFEFDLVEQLKGVSADQPQILNIPSLPDNEDLDVVSLWEIENPFVTESPSVTDMVDKWNDLYQIKPESVIRPNKNIPLDGPSFTMELKKALDDRTRYMTANEMRNKFGLRPRYTLSSGVEIESANKLLPPELYRINLEVEAGTRSSSFQTKRYSELTIWKVVFEPDTNVDERDPKCVERWPDCCPGEYNPSCCRFPKSCSCLVGRVGL